MNRTSFAIAAFLAWLPVCAQAQVETYTLDPVHSRVAFQVSHAGFSSPVGTFSGIDGELQFDESDWSTAKIAARIPIASLDLGHADWSRKILDGTYFDAGKFPQARFASTAVHRIDGAHLRIDGELTLHGVSAPVSLLATINAIKRHPLTLKKTAGFSATATLSRKAFGIDAWPSLIGDEVRVIIEVEAIRQRDRPSQGETDHADPQHD